MYFEELPYEIVYIIIGKLNNQNDLVNVIKVSKTIEKHGVNMGLVLRRSLFTH
mgnify:CR=1 FL=1